MARRLQRSLASMRWGANSRGVRRDEVGPIAQDAKSVGVLDGRVSSLQEEGRQTDSDGARDIFVRRVAHEPSARRRRVKSRERGVVDGGCGFSNVKICAGDDELHEWREIVTGQLVHQHAPWKRGIADRRHRNAIVSEAADNIRDPRGRRQGYDRTPDAIFNAIDGIIGKGIHVPLKPRRQVCLTVHGAKCLGFGSKLSGEHALVGKLTDGGGDARFEIESLLDEERVAHIEEHGRWRSLKSHGVVDAS